MTYTAIQNPLPVYNDTKGVPISGGRVFIGASGSDPEATPQAVYWDAAGTLPAAQPLQLKGGYIVNGSSPAQIFTTIPLSIRVYDNLGNVVWYKSTVTQLDQSALDAAAASIIASGTATINAAATTAAASASAAAASATTASTCASAAGQAAAASAVLPSTPAALPYEVTAIAITAGGSGGTSGTYVGGVSGGPAGFQWSYTISGGAVTAVRIDNPGISTSSTAPTLSFPSGGVTGATATATVATIPVGRVFWAVTADSGHIALWQNSAGSLAATNGPDGHQVKHAIGDSAFTTVNTPDYLEPYIDGNDNIAGGWKSDGSFDAAWATFATVEVGGNQFSELGVSDYLESYRDGSGNIAGGIKADGTFAFASAEFDYINGTPIADILAGGSGGATVATPSFKAGILGYSAYGQSLSQGLGGAPALSTAQTYDSLMFNVGVRTLSAGTPTSLVPLVESDTVDSSGGETPTAGALDRVKERLATVHQIAVGDYPFQLLGSASGQAAQVIASLSKTGGGAYTQLMADVANGKSLANAAGKSYAFGAWSWTQGSSDYQAGTSKSTYKAALEQLLSDVTADVRTATKQDFDPHCICGQSTDHWVYGSTNSAYIGVAQLEVSKAHANFHIATPLYFMPNADPHMTNVGYRWYAEYLGLCFYRTAILGETWQPLDCIEAYAQSTGSFHVVRARFHVPVGKLVWDTAMGARVANKGFTVLNSSGSACTISSVNIVGPDEVEFVLTSTAVGGTLANGRNNAGGCALRDQQGDSLTAASIAKPLHNFCVLFEKAL